MTLLTFLHAIWCLLAAVVIVRQKRTPSVALAWILAVVLLPVPGTLLYLLTGWRRPAPRPTDPAAACGDLHELVRRRCGAPLRTNNRVQLLHNGGNAYTTLIGLLQHARRSIHLEYYIFADDRIGRTIARILVRKARAGVEVRIICDAVGSWGFTRRLRRRMIGAGVAVAMDTRLRFPWFTPWANRRNHRKLALIDGQTACLGGINIARRYLEGDGTGIWRDEQLLLEGEAVADLQRLFTRDWQRLTREELPEANYIAEPVETPRCPVQVAWSEEGDSRPLLSETFVRLICDARERIRLSTPYLLPPPGVLDALAGAARSGVRVQVMIPARTGARLVEWAMRAYLDDLLAAGVEVWRFEPGFLHAKLFAVDHAVASVGTANFDFRSLDENRELLALLFDREAADDVVRTFDDDLRQCRRIDPAAWLARPGWQRTRDAFARLLAPLL